MAKVQLRGIELNNAALSEANLFTADLNGAILSGADLSRANLREADGWSEEHLAQAKSLEGATMPNGRKYEDWLKDREGSGKNGENGGLSYRTGREENRLPTSHGKPLSGLRLFSSAAPRQVLGNGL